VEEQISSKPSKRRSNAHKEQGKILKVQAQDVRTKRQLRLKGYPAIQKVYEKNRKRYANGIFERKRKRLTE
jgi:hypothetical protein